MLLAALPARLPVGPAGPSLDFEALRYFALINHHRESRHRKDHRHATRSCHKRHRAPHLADAFAGQDDHKRYVHKFLDVTRSQLLFASGALFVEETTEALLKQRCSELIGLSLRDHGIEISVIDSNEGFDHFRPLFAGERGPYTRGVFVTDGDEDPVEVKSDEFRADTDFSLDPGLIITGATATATGYGTFEFGLPRYSACCSPG